MPPARPGGSSLGPSPPAAGARSHLGSPATPRTTAGGRRRRGTAPSGAGRAGAASPGGTLTPRLSLASASRRRRPPPPGQPPARQLPAGRVRAALTLTGRAGPFAEGGRGSGGGHAPVPSLPPQHPASPPGRAALPRQRWQPLLPPPGFPTGDTGPANERPRPFPTLQSRAEPSTGVSPPGARVRAEENLDCGKRRLYFLQRKPSRAGTWAGGAG